MIISWILNWSLVLIWCLIILLIRVTVLVVVRSLSRFKCLVNLLILITIVIWRSWSINWILLWLLLIHLGCWIRNLYRNLLVFTLCLSGVYKWIYIDNSRLRIVDHSSSSPTNAGYSDYNAKKAKSTKNVSDNNSC